ncbi:unnamed protein product, partial [Amoebophrya sp. A25]
SDITVVGVLQSPNRNVHLGHYLPITLGFDSARGVLSEVAGNITLDAISSRKCYHFVRTGSTAITLEIALQIEPTLVLCNEEIYSAKKSLQQLVEEIGDLIMMRKNKLGLRSGVVLVSNSFMER